MLKIEWFGEVGEYTENGTQNGKTQNLIGAKWENASNGWLMEVTEK